MQRWLFGLIAVLGFAMLSIPAVAKNDQVSVYVVDFPTATGAGTARQYVDLIERNSFGDARYVIIDPREVRILFDGIDPDGGVARGEALGQNLRRIFTRSDVMENRRYDLAQTSELISQLVLANPEVKDWQVFFLAGIRHKDDEFSFEDGYPNDGFLFLKDSEFGYVTRLPKDGGPKIEVHLFHSEQFEYRNEFDRFMELWSREVWQAKLISFNDGIDIGNRPTYESAPINAGVDRSAIVKPGVRPTCETFDTTSVRETAYGRLEFTVSNQCRANSVVVLRVNETEFSGTADGSGRAVIEVVLKEGENVVSVRTPEGETFNEIHRHLLGEASDAVDVSVVDGKVTLSGYHPLREDGNLVTIRNPRMDRSWTVPVQQGKWVLKDVPLGPGLNQFEIVQTDGVNVVIIPVRNDVECQHSREVGEERGLAIITFTDSCLAGKSLTLNYLGQEYPVHFDGEGKAEFKIGLSQTVNRITYDLRGTERLIEIPVSSFAAMIRVTLEWDATVDLDLHVREPGEGHVFHAALQGSDGEIDRDDKGKQQGRHQETYVVLTEALANRDEIGFSVVNYARLNAGESISDHCAGGTFERVPFTVLAIVRGDSQQFDGEFLPFACDADPEALRAASTLEIFRHVEE